MNILYNKKLAAAILVIVILGTILLCGGRSLANARARQAQLFYTGTSDDGNSIANDLHVRCESGHNLMTVARRYMEANAPELKALETAVAALEGAAGPSEAFEANYAVTLAADHLYSVLNNMQLTDADKKLVSGQFTEMTSRNQTISHDGYNVKAAEFNELLKRFPTNIIAAAGGVAPLELFR
ncbi:MAG: LemA family protein [Oscillospiraceae bacterium]|nr:LemA family protein [Oscillospiraceae bacterium]